jgi:hypothetical protein
MMVNNPLHNPSFLSRKVHQCFTATINQMIIQYAEANAVFTNAHVIEKLKDCIKKHTNFPIVPAHEVIIEESFSIYNTTDKVILGKPDILLATNPEMAVHYVENDVLRWAPRSAANNYIIMAEALILLAAVHYYVKQTLTGQRSLFCLACKNAIQNNLQDYITNNQLSIPNIFEIHEVKRYCKQNNYDPQLFNQKHIEANFYGTTMIEADFTFLMFFGVG